MNQHFTQLDDGVSAEIKPASAIETVVGTVLLALLLRVFWHCYCSCYRNHVKKYFSSSSAVNLAPSTIATVETILNYTFKDKSLLEEALTHASTCCENMSYERLEFIGDAALGLIVATHFFRLEPKLNSGQLTDLRKDSVSNEKLARVSAKHGLYWFVRRINTGSLDRHVERYEYAVRHGDNENITVKPPAILADIVESLAGAVYLDVNLDLTKLFMIFKDLLKLDEIMLPKDEAEESSEITGAQNDLHGLCGERRWNKPAYSLLEENGCPHEKKYVYSVSIETEDGVLCETGDEKSTLKDARNSAAYRLIRSPYLKVYG